MRYGPVVDGRSVPMQTWDPNAPEISASIPMIIGCCKDETTLFAMRDEALFRLDNRLAGSYRQRGRPGSGDRQTDFRLSRQSSERLSERHILSLRYRSSCTVECGQAGRAKVAQGKADVYMYYFAWDTPCADGKIKAFHTAELPLSLRLVRYPESEQVSRQISGAWAAFARHGNPKHSGLRHGHAIRPRTELR